MKTHQKGGLSSKVFDVKKYGATCDGVTDDTKAVNKAVNAAGKVGGTVYFPDGTCLVSAPSARSGAIVMKDRVKLKLASGATIKLAPNGFDECYIIDVTGVSKVGIQGGSIMGDRTTHTGSTGEWGMGINLSDAANVVIKDIHISNCWGDGIYMGTESESGYCQNITIDNVVCDSNRRQGISVISVKGLVVRNSQGNNTRGTEPQSGMDIEPNFNTQFLHDIVIENFRTSNNAGYGITCWLGNYVDSPNDVSITIIDHKDYGSTDGTYGNLSEYINAGYNIKIKTTTKFHNLLVDGNFLGTSNWIPYGAAAAVEGNVLSVTGDGNFASPLVYQTTKLSFASGVRLYIKFKMRVTNDACSLMFGELRDTTWYGTRLNCYPDSGDPVQDVWETLSDIATIPAGGIKNLVGVLKNTYADAAAARGKVMQVKEAMLINLAGFGDYRSTITLGECDLLFRDWF